MKPNQRFVLIILVFLSWLLGAFGTYEALLIIKGCEPIIARLAESGYISLQLFTLDFPEFLFYSDAEKHMSYQNIHWTLHIARITSPLLTIVTILSLIADHLKKIWILRCIKKQKKHTVIYGFNLRARLFIENTTKKNRQKIVIVDPNLTDQDQEWISKKKCLPLVKNGASLEAPELCNAEQARYLIALHDDDSQNMRVLIRAYQRNEQKKGNLHKPHPLLHTL